MSFPTFDEMIDPLLRVLASAPDGLDARTAQRAVADRLNLSDADRQMTIASGQALFANRAGWAHDRLKRAELSASPKRGWWQLTEKGVAFVRQHPAPLSEAEVAALAVVRRDSRLRESDEEEASEASATQRVTTASPAELIDRAVAEIRESVSGDLIERIMNGSPSFFETLVLDLLHAMGYGTSRSDLQRVGGSGDGGIDGVVSLDRLGLEKVYVQAKRWSNRVGSPEIQTFMGALQLQHASKGVFMTTSAFTRDAIETAKRARGTIVLVDGRKLAELMIDHGVGVTPRPINIPRIDQDYFDEE
ncbi:MAG: restriction endonuclease [Kofleriaceae bacterium]|nr:MAG: restriction endonuclease [Kofleriaceae bacterium]MBZ0231763.1 restriction endonuclease [Kofleriaceae bacterium]